MQTVRELVARLAREEAALRGREFLAPLLVNGQARLRLGGLIHTLKVIEAQAGWWRCRAIDSRHGTIVAEAEPWQRGDYLALWPALRLVLIEQHAAGDWLALPFNLSDAFQRFGLRGPLMLRLTEGGQPFERVVARVEGPTLWYDEPDRRADPAIAEALRLALAEMRPQPGMRGLGPGEQAAYALLVTRRLAADAATATARNEQQIRAALEIGGARLLGYEPISEGWHVIWERAGQRGVTLVGANLDVISAGICLSGEDQCFDLASVIGVVEDAPEYARWEED